MGLEKEKRPNLYSGNIPGSINIPYTSLSKNGKFLKKNNLKKIFRKSMNLDKKKNIVCTCGSGITACNIILALDILGFNNYNLYQACPRVCLLFQNSNLSASPNGGQAYRAQFADANSSSYIHLDAEL